jgi:hypothetical protein
MPEELTENPIEILNLMSGDNQYVTLNFLYIEGNPQISHFKMTYKRHTNFVLEKNTVDNNTTLYQHK